MRRQLLALAIATTAAAQSQTGLIEGMVLDADGMPLAGAEVTTRSPTQIGGVKKAITDATGEFRFVGLTPGRFDVRASKTGLTTDERTGLWVGVNRTVTLTLLLVKAEAKTEVYVVKAERPVVDTRRTSAGESVPKEFIEKTPVLVRRPQSVTEFTPGVTGSGNPNIRGGAYFNNSYTVDGVDTTDPVTNTFGTNFNFDAIVDMEVQTAGLGAENGAVTGGVANIVTKSGSNAFDIDASVYHQDDHLALKDEAAQGATFREDNVNLNVAGPIVKDRLWYFGSIQYDDRVSSIPCDPDVLGAGLCPHPSLHRRGVLGLIKLSAQPAASHKLSLFSQGEFTGIENLTQEPTVAPEAERHQDQQTQILSATHDWLLTQKLFLRTQATYHRQRLEVFPESGDLHTFGYEADEVTGLASGNYTRVADDRRYRVSGQQTLTWFFDNRALDMEPRLGWKAGHAWNPSSERVTGDMTLRQNDGEPGSRTLYCAEADFALEDDDPKRCVGGASATTTKGTFASAFLEDALKPWRHLTVTPGVGLHHGKTINDADETITNFTTVTPHVNATWDPTRNGKTVVRAGYNQYVDVGFLRIPGFIGRQLASETCDWDPAARDYVANCTRRTAEGSNTVGHPQGPQGPETELRPPRTHELMAAVEREIAKGTSVGGEFVYRRYDHLFEDVETNVIWNERGNDAAGFRDPTKSYIFDLETPDEARRRYVSFSLTGRRYVGRWNFLSSYTWARSEGTYNPDVRTESFATVYLDNYTQNKYYDGFLPDDRRHTVKAYVSAQASKSLSVGMSFQYATGAPYNKYFFNDLYRDFTDFRAGRGTNPNDVNDPSDDTELRMPDLVELALKLDYNLARLTGINLDAIAEVFNLLNTNTPTRVEDRNLGEDAPVQFGDPIDRQDPLRVRLGVRYRY